MNPGSLVLRGQEERVSVGAGSVPGFVYADGGGGSGSESRVAEASEGLLTGSAGEGSGSSLVERDVAEDMPVVKKFGDLELREDYNPRGVGLLVDDDFEIVDNDGPSLSESDIFTPEEIREYGRYAKLGYLVDTNPSGPDAKKLEAIEKEIIAKGHKVRPFHHKADGSLAGLLIFKERGEGREPGPADVEIVFRGTKFFAKDLLGIDGNTFYTTSRILPEGGLVHRGFYLYFNELWDDLYTDIFTTSMELVRNGGFEDVDFKDVKVTVVGHSLGAALASLTALRLRKFSRMNNVRVITYESPRVFNRKGAQHYEAVVGYGRTLRIHQKHQDPVTMVPLGSCGFKHVGVPFRVVKKPHFLPHKMEGVMDGIDDLSPEDFKKREHEFTQSVLFQRSAPVERQMLSSGLFTWTDFLAEQVGNVIAYAGEKKREWTQAEETVEQNLHTGYLLEYNPIDRNAVI